MLFQGLREVLPLGKLFTPILHHVVKIVNRLESENIKDVSFYRETTAFVKYLQQSGYSVQVTGHSLGKSDICGFCKTLTSLSNILTRETFSFCQIFSSS